MAGKEAFPSEVRAQLGSNTGPQGGLGIGLGTCLSSLLFAVG